MTVRLPIFERDEDSWGTRLNEFLLVAHNSDGTLKERTMGDPTDKDTEENTLIVDTIYKAQSDGILTVKQTGTPTASIFVGSSSPPTTDVHTSIVAVPAYYYVKVENVAALDIIWTPLSSLVNNGLVKQ